MLTMKPLTFFLAFSAILVLPTSSITNEDDVFALNVLFTAMGAAPTLDGWSGQGGDPCSDNWKGIVCVGPNITELNLSGLNLMGTLGYALDKLRSLMILDLSNNQIKGSLPFQLPLNIQKLLLANNQLIGVLPYSLTYMSKLTDLNISNNELNGNIPDVFQTSLTDLYLGNGFNISSGTISALPPSPSPSGAESIVPMGAIIQEPLIGSADSEQGLSGGYIAGIVAALMIIILVAITVILFFMWKSKELAIKSKDACFLQGYLINTNTKFKHRSISDTATMKYMIPKGQKARDVDKTINSGISATIFNFGELQAGTNNFSQEKLIGEGASARVYKGTLKSGKVMAIKNIDTSAHMVPDKEFFDVLMGISRLRHANVVELVGYCTENGHRMLVYEYIDNGTLHEALHSEEDKNKLLTWNIRIKIALGAARALEYLHEICEPMVVHCNFKSSNILLDEDFTPRLSDCGLFALTYFGSQCQLPEQHVGSFGYSAPEFALSGVFSAKSDVYSFGVVMLELLTGRKPLDSSRPRAEQSLVCWAAPQLNDIDALSKIVDPSLKGIYPAKSLARFADVVALCVQAESDLRPPMSEVVQSLVHLVQRASVTRRQSGDELGLSQRYMERQDVGSE
ncbi:hypothetical protein KP509_30G028700 [Ceratopteris richardii]|uniref:Protein kinase domain-containing protein n=1 Tax=Ceratopteris richardii TaxID=49495 RepID=A0A8T2R102_CERRI|nr:hypothetical protein KP509_30G028700 [Ceratopteris richardii]